MGNVEQAGWLPWVVLDGVLRWATFCIRVALTLSTRAASPCFPTPGWSLQAEQVTRQRAMASSVQPSRCRGEGRANPHHHDDVGLTVYYMAHNQQERARQ